MPRRMRNVPASRRSMLHRGRQRRQKTDRAEPNRGAPARRNKKTTTTKRRSHCNSVAVGRAASAGAARGRSPRRKNSVTRRECTTRNPRSVANPRPQQRYLKATGEALPLARSLEVVAVLRGEALQLHLLDLGGLRGHVELLPGNVLVVALALYGPRGSDHVEPCLGLPRCGQNEVQHPGHHHRHDGRPVGEVLDDDDVAEDFRLVPLFLLGRPDLGVEESCVRAGVAIVAGLPAEAAVELHPMQAEPRLHARSVPDQRVVPVLQYAHQHIRAAIVAAFRPIVRGGDVVRGGQLPPSLGVQPGDRGRDAASDLRLEALRLRTGGEAQLQAPQGEQAGDEDAAPRLARPILSQLLRR
mmetsp:Transcript_58249/g.168730  ORF Transcript_58249/g.168730 Transcript_58249/m.168730 type:complete len:356 (+) Transcript_58249:118-1185(+)